MIRTSSEEIDKMIELYYNFNLGEEVEDSKEMKHPLYKSTFNYMMNNEPKLKVTEIRNVRTGYSKPIKNSKSTATSLIRRHTKNLEKCLT